MALKIAILALIPEKGLASDEEVDGRPRDGMSVFRDGFLKHAKKITRPDTEVTMVWPEKYSGSLWNLYLATVNNLPLVNKIIKLEEEGYDAVVVGCHADCGVQIARSVVHIPVIGPFEASMAMSHFVGEKFAVITIHDHYIPVLQQLIRQFGFEDRFIKHKPVRVLDRWLWPDMMDAIQGKPARLIELFEKKALECIGDGADTVMVPGYPFGAALSLAGYTKVTNTGVAVVDGNAAALKMAEILADLHHSIGLTRTGATISLYQEVPREFVDRARREFER